MFCIILLVMNVKTRLSLKEVEAAVKNFNKEEQKQLLNDLPKLLYLSAEEINLLKLAEPSFKFWENSDDSIYDSL